MEIIYLLIPLSMALVAVIIGFVIWAVKSGQFEDLDRPGHAILDDDDGIQRPSAQQTIKKTDQANGS